MYFEMHKHTHYSSYDGFDKINNIVAYAKELGHKAIGISDHGNACGIIQLYSECKKQDLKPLMGVEAYFQPVFNPDKQKYHLCLYATSAVGYENLCQLISEANEQNFFRTMTVDFKLLAKYTEDIICTSACIAGFLSQSISKGNKGLALKAAKQFKKIYGDNFYIELQPMKIDNEGTQERVNETLMKLGKKLGIKTILTSDSHFTRKEDFDSYMMMHQLSKLGSKGKGEGSTLEHIEETYKERYMYSEDEICKKFKKMHGFYPQEQLDAMEEIYDKIDVELDFSSSIPVCDDYEDAYKALKEICIEELKETGRYNKKYLALLKYEVGVIKKHGLCDYFLIVRDYVKYAKDNGIYVGPGRGSCGGSLTTDLLGITDVDPVILETDFDRFLRPDKKKMPDIDIDFENGRQQEVIQYIIDKYAGRASKIMTFGYYKSSSLINELAQVYDITSKAEVARIKAILSSKVADMAHFEFEDVDYNYIMKDSQVRDIDKEYKHFVKHFAALVGQVRYYGQHPAGVLVTRTEIAKWVPMMKVKGQMICSYDKYDCEAMDMVKFDVLALKTLNVLKEIEEATNDRYNRHTVSDETYERMYREFSRGNSSAVFQLNSNAAKGILSNIEADNIQDLIAAISLNRPGPLKLKTHEQYAINKQNVDDTTVWYPYTKDAYGSIIYQEHVMRICIGLANMPMDKIDKLMKFKFSEDEREDLKQLFIDGAKRHSGIKSNVSGPLFDAMTLYLFNKGHAAGYALVSEWQMYHKVMHPIEFWCYTLKWEYDEKNKSQFLGEAVNEGVVIFLPHVNYSADYTVRKVEGEKIVQMGYGSLKNVGPKAQEVIENERKKGPFRSYDDFYDRCKGRGVTSAVIDSLLENGALEFDKNKYIKRVTQYNRALYMRGLRK